MGENTVRIGNVTVKKGDVVEIKFKKMEDIVDFYKQHGFRASDVFNQTRIGEHLVALTRGGFFHVEDVVEDGEYCLPEIGRNKMKPKGYERPQEIVLNDHNETDVDLFTINEHLIESIEVREDIGERYFSDKFQLSLLLIDGLLVINGVTLDKDDKDLINILEKTIADMSIRSMLESSDDKDKVDNF